MAAIDRNEVGVHASGTTARFGVYLPGIRDGDGYAINARVIHRADQFVPEVPPVPQALAHQAGHPLDLWSGTLDVAAVASPRAILNRGNPRSAAISPRAAVTWQTKAIGLRPELYGEKRPYHQPQDRRRGLTCGGRPPHGESRSTIQRSPSPSRR